MNNSKNYTHLRGTKHKTMSQVNLDALIPREDLFKVEEDEPIGNSSHVRLSELRLDADLDPRKSYFFKTLRKADFQRETSEWRPERVVGLIKSFIKDDIIPAVILWNWKGTNYIIDGGHRLSAIVSWVVNDYGNGTLSKAYFGEVNITKEQRKNHDKTLELINADSEIGAYETYLHALDNPKAVSPEMLSKARILVGRSIQVQYIKAQSSKDAEKSFFRINGEATPINDTEAVILKSREKPNAIAARAIIHSGNAHRYWDKFKGRESEIEALSIKINKLLFEPELDTKIVHFPIGGSVYSSQSLELVFGTVNMINGLDEINHKRKELLKLEPDKINPPKDPDGSETIVYLKKVERIVSLISSSESPISLGLHPLIYFYSNKGRFQISSFFAIIHLFLKWDNERKVQPKSLKFQQFSSVRDAFEDFILKYKSFITQATNNVGSGLKSYERLSKLFEFIIECLIENKSEEMILKEINEIRDFSFIKVFDAVNSYEENRNPYAKKPAKSTATEVVINTFLNANIVCPICNARASNHSYNIDHILEVRNGGLGNKENLRVTHCYCNEERETITLLKSKLNLPS